MFAKIWAISKVFKAKEKLQLVLPEPKLNQYIPEPKLNQYIHI